MEDALVIEYHLMVNFPSISSFLSPSSVAPAPRFFPQRRSFKLNIIKMHKTKYHAPSGQRIYKQEAIRLKLMREDKRKTILFGNLIGCNWNVFFVVVVISCFLIIFLFASLLVKFEKTNFSEKRKAWQQKKNLKKY